MSKWLPIDTAPKDGTAVLVTFWPHHGPDKSTSTCAVAAWWKNDNGVGGDWVIYCSLIQEPRLYFTPTHWMPLPPPPSEEYINDWEHINDCEGI